MNNGSLAKIRCRLRGSGSGCCASPEVPEEEAQGGPDSSVNTQVKRQSRGTGDDSKVAPAPAAESSAAKS